MATPPWPDEFILSDFCPVGYYMDEMSSESDVQLLRAYADHGAEAAFTELVHRYTNLVYSVALRLVDSPDAAAEIAQHVFIGLARSATTLLPQLSAEASLASWLCRCTRNRSLNHRRDAFRRQIRERQTMEQLSATSEAAPDWDHLRRVLDAAMAELDEADHDAVVLRYFQQQDYRAIGRALGVSDDTAQKRVTRALETLRVHLSRRGIHTTTAALSLVISANAVQAAPVGLAATIATATLTSMAVPTAIAVTKTIAMTTLQKTLVAVTIATLAGTGIYEARQASQLRTQNQLLQQALAPLTEQNQQLQRERDEATSRLAGLLAENAELKSNPDKNELLKLRGEVARLQSAAKEAGSPSAETEKAIAAKVKWLQECLNQMPDKKIAELQLISQTDWINAIWNVNLDTDDGIREALSKVRDRAESVFLGKWMQAAFKKYLAANDDRLPANLLELKPYFDVAVTDEMLQHYQLLQTGKIDNNAPLVKLSIYADPDYDSDHSMSINGAGGSRFNKVQAAVETAIRYFQADNNGQFPDSPAQIAPYLKTPIESVTLQKYFNQSQQ